MFEQQLMMYPFNHFLNWRIVDIVTKKYCKSSGFIWKIYNH
jgi:hypothetical protein